MLLIDTNVLLRISQGRAMLRVQGLRAREVSLATTDRNIDEMETKLVDVFGWSEDDARAEINRVIEALRIIPARDYEHRRRSADDRLRQGGKSDWPALSAALALDAEIWSDDVDYFGVGVPVWSTPNTRFVDAGTP